MRVVLMIVMLFLGVCAHAETKPYFLGDFGVVHTEYTDELGLSLGLGFELSGTVEFEIAHNQYGEIIPFANKVTSNSVGVNIGGYIKPDTKLQFILGSEKLKASGKGYYYSGVEVTESEGFYGFGSTYIKSETSALRVRFVIRDSGDIKTVTVGFAKYF